MGPDPSTADHSTLAPENVRILWQLPLGRGLSTFFSIHLPHQAMRLAALLATWHLLKYADRLTRTLRHDGAATGSGSPACIFRAPAAFRTPLWPHQACRPHSTRLGIKGELPTHPLPTHRPVLSPLQPVSILAHGQLHGAPGRAAAQALCRVGAAARRPPAPAAHRRARLAPVGSQQVPTRVGG